MSPDKRYCKNRVSKRKTQSGKRNLCVINEDPSGSIEEERQFKLSRFVKDVNKFVEEKKLSDETYTRGSRKERVADFQKPFQTEVSSKPMAKKGLFRNAVQTKYYTRGLTGKEMTARLDEDLRQIIALATNNKENECHCSHQRSKPVDLQPIASTTASVDREPLHTLILRTPTRAKQWTGEALQTTPDSESMTSRLAQLDRELYPDFTRLITNSAIETLNTCFSGISFSSMKKKELLDIYMKAKRENSQESAGLSETQKSSVGTSPICSQISHCSSPPQNLGSKRDGGSETFRLNFVPEPWKSLKQVLEEEEEEEDDDDDEVNSRSVIQSLFSLPLESQERVSPSPQPHTRCRSPPSWAPSFEDRFNQSSPVPSYFTSPPANDAAESTFDLGRPQSTRTFQPSRPQSTRIFEPDRPQSTRTFELDRPQSTCIFELDRPQSTSTFEPDRPQSIRTFEPDRPQSILPLSRFSSLLPLIEEESPEFQYYPKFLF